MTKEAIDSDFEDWKEEREQISEIAFDKLIPDQAKMVHLLAIIARGIGDLNLNIKSLNRNVDMLLDIALEKGS